MELMVALAVLSLSMGAALVLGIGQSSAQDSEAGREALNVALAVAYDTKAIGQSDFRALHASTSTYSVGSTTYAVTTEVTQESFFTKSVRSIISWGASYARTLSIEIPFLVTDTEHAVGGNTCYSEVDTDAWKTPSVQNSERDFSKIVFDASTIYTLAAVDAYKDRLYVGAGGTSSKTNPTFFVFNIQNPATPAFIGSIDTSTSTISGIAAVRVAEHVGEKKTYAYVANNYGANFSTCSAYYNCAQLQIIDVTNPQTFTVASIKNYKVPGVTGTQGAGKSLTYQGGYVYLGLAGTGNKGPEFHIVDVHDPEDPQFVGSYAVGSGVAAIVVRGPYAYVATDDLSKELIVLNISNKSAPQLAGSYNALSDVTNFGYGKSLDAVGKYIYLGRTFISNAPEFQILDGANPSSIPPPPIGTRDTGPNSTNPFSLNGIMIRNTLAFLLLGSGTKGGSMQIVSIANPANTQGHATVALPSGNNGTGGASFDCEGDIFYIVSNDVQKKGYLSVISTQ